MDPPADLIEFSGVKRRYSKFRKSFPREVILNSKCHARFKVNEKCQIKVFHSTSLPPSPNPDSTYYTFSGPALYQSWDRCWNLMRNKMHVFFYGEAHSQGRFLIHRPLKHIYKQNLYLKPILI